MISTSAIEEFFISKMRIGSHKFHAMNILKWKRNYNKYIEFRSIGNVNYEYKEKDIKKFIDVIARSMLSCVSETSRKKDYLSRLKALITPSH
jgi:membrane protease subunit (stomatin/prohibitin family)